MELCLTEIPSWTIPEALLATCLWMKVLAFDRMKHIIGRITSEFQVLHYKILHNCSISWNLEVIE